MAKNSNICGLLSHSSIALYWLYDENKPEKGVQNCFRDQRAFDTISRLFFSLRSFCLPQKMFGFHHLIFDFLHQMRFSILIWLILSHFKWKLCSCKGNFQIINWSNTCIELCSFRKLVTFYLIQTHPIQSKTIKK